MINNARSLLDKSKNFANKNNVTVQQAVQYFMFERFLDRLAHSEYKEKFVLKGGFLLSAIMGISVRSTMDMDANIYGLNFEESEITKMVSDIIQIDLNDNTAFEFNKSEIIREDNEYGGFKIKLTGKFFNLRVPIHIDMSTGDVITPRAIEYSYKTILEDEQINIYTYNYETIISEKLQTILVRNNSNSRMKDLYDLYYFITYKINDIDKKILHEAIIKTFKNRKSEHLLSEIDSILSVIKNDSTQNKLWIDYSEKFEYAKDIKLDEVIDKILKIKKYVY